MTEDTIDSSIPHEDNDIAQETGNIDEIRENLTMDVVHGYQDDAGILLEEGNIIPAVKRYSCIADDDDARKYVNTEKLKGFIESIADIMNNENDLTPDEKDEVNEFLSVWNEPNKKNNEVQTSDEASQNDETNEIKDGTPSDAIDGSHVEVLFNGSLAYLGSIIGTLKVNGTTVLLTPDPGYGWEDGPLMPVGIMHTDGTFRKFAGVSSLKRLTENDNADTSDDDTQTDEGTNTSDNTTETVPVSNDAPEGDKTENSDETNESVEANDDETDDGKSSSDDEDGAGDVAVDEDEDKPQYVDVNFTNFNDMEGLPARASFSGSLSYLGLVEGKLERDGQSVIIMGEPESGWEEGSYFPIGEIDENGRIRKLPLVQFLEVRRNKYKNHAKVNIQPMKMVREGWYGDSFESNGGGDIPGFISVSRDDLDRIANLPPAITEEEERRSNAMMSRFNDFLSSTDDDDSMEAPSADGTGVYVPELRLHTTDVDDDWEDDDKDTVLMETSEEIQVPDDENAKDEGYLERQDSTEQDNDYTDKGDNASVTVASGVTVSNDTESSEESKSDASSNDSNCTHPESPSLHDTQASNSYDPIRFVVPSSGEQEANEDDGTYATHSPMSDEVHDDTGFHTVFLTGHDAKTILVTPETVTEWDPIPDGHGNVTLPQWELDAMTTPVNIVVTGYHPSGTSHDDAVQNALDELVRNGRILWSDGNSVRLAEASIFVIPSSRY